MPMVFMAIAPSKKMKQARRQKDLTARLFLRGKKKSG